MKRRVGLILLLLVAGAIVNVAVAWSLALWTKARRGLINGPDMSRVVFPPYQGGDIPNATEITALWGEYVGLRISETMSREPLVYARSVRAGWPALAFSGSLINNNYSMGVMKAPQWSGPSPGVRSTERLIPLSPMWPGFAINTVFYAGILWFMFAAPFALRRRRRIKRGLCPACAYPVGERDVCTECGGNVVVTRTSIPPQTN